MKLSSFIKWVKKLARLEPIRTPVAELEEQLARPCTAADHQAWVDHGMSCPTCLVRETMLKSRIAAEKVRG